MVEEIIDKRAKELEESFKSGAGSESLIEEAMFKTEKAIMPLAAKAAGAVKKVHCKECFQETELPLDTTTFTCRICGTTQTV